MESKFPRFDMTRHLLTSALALLGIALIAVGLSWNSLFPPASYWSEDQAAEYNSAFNAVHTAQDASHHGGVTDHKALDDARERFLNIRGDLERAQQARGRSSKAVTVSGLLLLLVALVARRYWPQNDKNDR
jgi:hypothetical protein